jgi:lipopolysaccharide/colanic/teichoic acid biosynthesis glycosyltransferase/glycosyltransferase involved in cell wall biosynthesis
MKILILTQWFEPEPDFKGMLFARELAALGYEVEVLTGFPNYPGGKVYPGYRIRPWVRESIEGIDVLRVALYPSHNKSGLHRFLNYASFALSAAVIGTVLIRKPDVIYVYHPPITVGFAAVVIGFFRRSPFVYDICDLWPDTVAASGMISNSAALRFLGGLCRFVYSRASHITVVSQGFRDTLVVRGVPSNKIDVIYNWCDEKAFNVDHDPVARLASSADKFCILFAGTMGTAQGLVSVLQAAQICLRTAPLAEFVFVGGGVERAQLERMATEMRLDNVQFLPRQPIQAMGGILAGADTLLVHLKDDPLFRITIPSKTQAYMAAGKPILMAVRGDAADLVKQSQSGVLCDPGNPQGIANAVKELSEAGSERLAVMGRSGRAFYENTLSLNIGVEKFDRVFKAAADLSTNMRHQQSGWRFRIKTAFDRGTALCGLIILSPLFIAVSLLVWLSVGRPIVFRQQRPGRFAKPFMLLKFRTMLNRLDADGELRPDAERLTRIGQLLRETSIDELPQLWNVLRGDISFVGPRPLLMEYLPLYSSEQARRHDVMPGITGWAQINGRNSLTWEEKFALDVSYVNSWSLQFDALILLNTVVAVLRRKGIANAGHATMPGFNGTAAVYNPHNDGTS